MIQQSGSPVGSSVGPKKPVSLPGLGVRPTPTPQAHTSALGAGVPGSTSPSLLPTSLASAGASLLPTSLAKGGAQLFSPTLAATLAGTQYNQAITDAQQNLAMTQSGADQALANVGQWWSSILGGQKQAQQNTQAIDQSVSHDEAGNNASLLASLGGSANPGAAGVGEEATADQGTLSALNANNQQYEANMSPILQLGAAGAKTAQQNQNTANIAAAMKSVNDNIAAKGATQAQDAYQIAQDNNTIRDNQQSRLLQIMQGNNTVKDNRVTSLENIVSANNTTLNNAANLTETQKVDAHNYALSLDTLHDNEKQTKVGMILTLGVDPVTGALTPDAAQAVSQLTGINSKALNGVSPTVASTIIKGSITAGIDTGKAAQPDATLSARLGHEVDHNGNPVGSTAALPGFKQLPNGTYVKTASPSTSTAGLLTTKEASDTVTGWKTGTYGSTTTTERTGTDSSGNPKYTDVHTNAAGMTYPQALAKAKGYPKARDRAQLIAQVNGSYQEGEGGRPFTGQAALTQAQSQAQHAVQSGDSYQVALHKITSSGLLPRKLVVAALTLAYHVVNPAVSPDIAGPSANYPPSSITPSEATGSGPTTVNTTGR